ncbi:NAD(P)-dependent alcohol dehydrogenase [Paraconexibacter sp.]|uniref:NAD(P)-dependent alcohol dehydrogenase n=1 Tax=Paraconexibacter sp. TaxID=2949640 RepID=UPI003564FC93
MTTTATAAILREIGEPLTLEEVQVDAPGEGEVLVRMRGAGICHTDATGMDGTIPLPLPSVLGHEGSGVVEAIGEGVTDLAPGDHVVLSFGHCGDCTYCNKDRPAYCEMFAPLNYFGTRMDGTVTMHQGDEDIHGCFFSQSSFATYAISLATNTVKVAKDLPIELLGPLGCGLQTGAGTVLNVLRPETGESIAIFGMGGVGLSAVMAAKIAGCDPIIAVDINDERLALARSLGATHTFNAKETKDLVWEIMGVSAPGVHYALDAVGTNEVIRQALESTRTPAVVATVGFQGLEHDITIDQGHLLVGRTLTGVIEGDSNPQDFIPALVEHYANGEFPFDRLIKTFPFSQINEAFEAANSGAVVKPVLLFD